jgi:hypothetical protein
MSATASTSSTPPNPPKRLDLKYRALAEAAADLGGVPTIRAAFINFQRHLYAP